MEEILKSMMEEMQTKEEEFNRVVAELNTLEENYAARKQQLLDAREQIRGAYTALHIQYEKFKAPEEQAEPKVGQNIVEKIVENVDKKKEEPKVEKKKEPKKVEKKDKKEEPKENVVAGLTPEEIDKINKAVTQPGKKDERGNEIPEYLQPEFNK